MQTVIIVIHLMIVLAMIGLVLLQKSEGGGLGMGGGGRRVPDQPRHLQRADPHHAILAAVFFATSLFLSILAGLDRKPRSILDPAERQPRPERRPNRAPPATLGPAACSTGWRRRATAAPARRPHRPARRCRAQ